MKRVLYLFVCDGPFSAECCLSISNLKMFILKHTKLLCCLYECETLAPTLWAQHRLSVSKSWVLRKMHVSEMEKVKWGLEETV